MKKLCLILFLVGISTLSYAQFPGGRGREQSRSFLSRLFHHGQRPRAQMHHFDKSPKDPYLKDNGTSYIRNKKRAYVVDGNGFDIARPSKRERRHKPSIAKPHE